MSNTHKNRKLKIIFGVFGLVFILFISFNIFQFNLGNIFPYSYRNSVQTPIHASDITNVTDANLTVLYPNSIGFFYINPANGLNYSSIENLKNETNRITTTEFYPNANYGNIYADVSFDATGIDISELTIMKLNWEGRVFSTASSVTETKFNIYINNDGTWDLLHNATNLGNSFVDRKFGWWEHEITTNIEDYVSSDTLILRFEAEQSLPSNQTNWYLYMNLFWANVILGKNIDFVRINASSVRLIYNDSQYEQIGSVLGLNTDEDGNTLSIILNQIEQAGRNNITYDIGFDLGTYYLDDIYGFAYYHNDWFQYDSVSDPPPEMGTISIINEVGSECYPIQHLRDPPIVYSSEYPKQGYAGYIIQGNNWLNSSQFWLRYYRDLSGMDNWAKIDMDLGYIEVIRRTSPIFSVNFENTSKYIYQTEYVNIFVENWNTTTTDIRILSTEGQDIIASTEGNYTYEITRDTKGWVNFSVQLTDNQENIVTKGRYCIWFDTRPLNFDISLKAIPEKVIVDLCITDVITGDPVPNRKFDLLIFRYNESEPYDIFYNQYTNASGMYSQSHDVSPYLNERYIFNFTTYEDIKYDRCSVEKSIICDDATPKFTIVNVDYDSEFSGEQVTIYYELEDWTVSIVSATLNENGMFFMSLPASSGSHQVSFLTKQGNNNYTLWARNINNDVGESGVINLNLQLKPVILDVLTLYLDNFYYFLIDVKDNQTRSSLDGVPVQVAIYDSGFLMFTGTITTHSAIFGGFPFDQTSNHNFLLKAEITSNDYVNLKKEAQIPFEAYPYEIVLTFGLIIPAIIGIVFIPQILRRRWKFKRFRDRRLD